ncbi:hypothetical protein, partial [Enterobacter cloacae]|uniref:hypothetical protein n=1 Tax=Enterobacter cloacae TaxID=550 RepID=UPI00195497A8
RDAVRRPQIASNPTTLPRPGSAGAGQAPRPIGIGGADFGHVQHKRRPIEPFDWAGRRCDQCAPAPVSSSSISLRENCMV